MNDIETLSMQNIAVVLYDGWSHNAVYCFYHRPFFSISTYGKESKSIKKLYSMIESTPQSKVYLFDIKTPDMNRFDAEMVTKFMRGEDIELNHFMKFVEKYGLVPTVIEKRN